MNKETTSLLPRANAERRENHLPTPRRQGERRIIIPAVATLLLATIVAFMPDSSIHRSQHYFADEDEGFVWTVPLLGQEHGNLNVTEWKPPTPQRRCEWVAISFRQRDEGEPEADLREKYAAQTQDLNVFYRATAHIFWKDFVLNGWGEGLKLVEFSGREKPAKIHGVPLNDKSVWTWVTGDQHLSNFGAWRNRNGKVVFSVSTVLCLAQSKPSRRHLLTNIFPLNAR